MNSQIAVKKNKSISTTLIKLILDLSLFTLFLVVYQEKATGITWHEWLGVGIVFVIVTHVLLNWQWVANITKRFLAKLKAEPRINYVVDLGIFIGFVTLIFSGLMMSERVLPFFGIEAAGSPFWKGLHSTAADVVVWLTAAHVALHWRWIANALKRYAVTPIVNFARRAVRQPAAKLAPAKASSARH